VRQGRDNPLRDSVQDEIKVRNVQPGPGFSVSNRRIKGLEAYWIEEVRRKVLARRRPCSIRAAPSKVSAHIAPYDTAASSFDETLTLEDIEVLLGRMVRLEEDTLPDSNRSDCQSARSARSAFNIISTTAYLWVILILLVHRVLL
jgi:hypothetical protein